MHDFLRDIAVDESTHVACPKLGLSGMHLEDVLDFPIDVLCSERRPEIFVKRARARKIEMQSVFFNKLAHLSHGPISNIFYGAHAEAHCLRYFRPGPLEFALAKMADADRQSRETRLRFGCPRIVSADIFHWLALDVAEARSRFFRDRSDPSASASAQNRGAHCVVPT